MRQDEFFGIAVHHCRAGLQTVTIPAFKEAAPAGDRAEQGAPERINWELYREGIHFLAVRALGDRALAEDIAQETILRAVKALDDPNRAPILDHVAFLHGIARHLIVDAQRARYRSRQAAISDSIPSEHPDALNAILSAEQSREMRRTIQKLSTADRHLLELAFLEGLKSPEIAARLGESPEGIRKRKSRLLERLRAVLGAE